jgi:bifunctional enzyme CysN/CysC
MCHEDQLPHVSTLFRVNMIWLGKKPFVQDRDYKLKIHTQSEPVRIRKINKVIDASEAGRLLTKNQVDRHDVADLVLETRRPISFDSIQESEATGRFVLVDGYDIAGGGIIISSENDNQEEFRAEARLRDFNWIKGGVSRDSRTKKFGHEPALVMFVGKAGVGKHKFARAVERALFNKGHSTYMLDGNNVLLGVDADLIWKESTQHELVRRFAEVAHLMLDAGLIVVSTTNSIGLADFAAVQALIPDFPVIAIEVDTNHTETINSDLQLNGHETEDEVVNQVQTLLAKKHII